MKWLEGHLKVKSTKYYFGTTRNNNEIIFGEKHSIASCTLNIIYQTDKCLM